jgi:uncharacterized protein (TIGR02145 family)
MKISLIGFAVFFVCLSCENSNQHPVGMIHIFPTTGDTSLLFEYNGEGSTDDHSYPIGLVFRWDIDGNDVWDSEFEHFSTFAHKYIQPGNYLVKMEVKDLDGLTSIVMDSVQVFGENLDIGTLNDPRDGNIYKTIKIDGSWWMSENLRFGKLIPNSWEQTDNDTVERYRFTDWKTCDSIGGVYTWFEAMNYEVDNPKGICPDGWHIPSNEEWRKLYQAFPMSYAHKYFGKNGLLKPKDCKRTPCYGHKCIQTPGRPINEGSGNPGTKEEKFCCHHGLEPQLPDCSERAGPEIFGNPARGSLGFGYNLCANLSGLALFNRYH